MICCTHDTKLSHISLFMNTSSSFEKIQICLMIKKKDLVYKKIKYVFLYVKKIVFGEIKKRFVLLSKTKSFGSKTSDLFWELEKKK